jgi:hypothetical protein
LEVAEQVSDVRDDVAGRQDELEPLRCRDVKRSARRVKSRRHAVLETPRGRQNTVGGWAMRAGLGPS